jgi:hypothetical protein
MASPTFISNSSARFLVPKSTLKKIGTIENNIIIEAPIEDEENEENKSDIDMQNYQNLLQK